MLIIKSQAGAKGGAINKMDSAGVLTRNLAVGFILAELGTESNISHI